MQKTIAIIGALDTKGEDLLFVKNEIEKHGLKTIVIDVSVVGDPFFKPDIPSSEVAKAGGTDLTELKEKQDKSLAMEVMTHGITKVIKKLYEEGKIDGVISLGGSAGTVIGTSAMKVLPIGIPKLMVSTVASGDTRPYVGTKDIVMIPSVVDIAGINKISAKIYTNAASAICGMVKAKEPKIEEKPLVAASMFGNTTPIVNYCSKRLKESGYEVLVFHAVGTGGQTMEDLIKEGYFKGVMDITTTELADELVGGVLSAGPNRLEAAAETGTPQVVAPGCVDMVNFWAPETIPEKFKGRKFYRWNPNVTLMRTTPEENAELGKIIAQKLNKSKGPVAVFLPLKGVSMLDAPGREFWWPEADKALFEAIKTNIRQDIPVYELDYNINDNEFAEAMASKMLEFLNKKEG